MKVKETSEPDRKLLVQELPQVILLGIFIIISLILLALIFQWQPLKLTTTLQTLTNRRRPGSMGEEEECDIFSGEWVPNPKAPYYTNTSCSRIHEQQNCMKYGRPDSEFIKWRWKPHGCELPLFNPEEFLELVRGKSIAFVGDSVARNHMESLICLLSRVQHPTNETRPGDDGIQRWKYMENNFSVAMFWSPHLVRATTTTTVFNLYLDEVDPTWIGQIDEFDYVILSGGHWFLGPMIFYEKRQIVGCQYCQTDNNNNNVTYGFTKAFKTVLSALNARNNFRGVTYLRTYSPAHYEGGAWNQGGNCVRTRPFKTNETALADEDRNHYLIQIQELRKAEAEAEERNTGKKFRLFDTTHAMLLRPDGHPSKYGHWVHENATLHNDCLHWCLPGPIDSWSDMFQYTLKLDYIN